MSFKTGVLNLWKITRVAKREPEIVLRHRLPNKPSRRTDVVIHFFIRCFPLSIPLAEMAGFTPFLLQLLALHLSTCLVSGHPPSNQSSLSPLPLASSRLSSVVLSLFTHFKIQGNPQNTIIIPPQHTSISSNSIFLPTGL